MAALLAACRQDMHDQPKYEPYEKSEFFADGRSVRPQVAGTVARGQLREDAVFYTGRAGGALVASIPVPVTMATLQRGRERFDIFCAPCHGQRGGGDGLVVRRGFRQPASFHLDRIRSQPDGFFYDVITNGFGAMPDYAAQVTPADRWAIVAYLRALQLSENATLADVLPERRGELDQPVSRPALPMPRPDTGIAPADPRFGTGAAAGPRSVAEPGAAPASPPSPERPE
ncbi:MAG TPA: cytochrome c [Vicinamibacteria bacterium]|nr:cytochrome c [Vicinamibacteria bacterium]